jgi:hypothetical protein
MCSEIGPVTGHCEMSFVTTIRLIIYLQEVGLVAVKEELFEEQLQESQKPIGLLQKLRLQTS